SERQHETSLLRWKRRWPTGCGSSSCQQPKEVQMKRVSPYLKMRVLGAIEFAPGNTIIARIRHVSSMVHTDEADRKYVFTWRTIQTWYSRYKKDGITSMHPRTRADKGS